MKIGIIVPQFPTRTETFFINLVAGLCEEGHDVIVFSHGKTDRELLQAFALTRFRSLRVVHFHFSFFYVATMFHLLRMPGFMARSFSRDIKTWRSRVYRKLCLEKLKAHACDVYHYGYSGIGIAHLESLDKLPGKKMVSCRGTAENVLSITETGRPEKLEELFLKVDAIHCVSAALAEKIKHFGASHEKIFINRPAVNIQFFKKEKTNNQPSARLQILSVGRLVFQKGYSIGLLAMAVLKKRFENFTWVIAGDGPGKEELIFMINKLQLTDHVYLAGRKNLQEIKELYAQADIFFLPSVCEGIANVVLEAMAMELAVVSSDCGGMREVITPGENGLLCENYNYEAYADALYSLCRDEEKRKHMGQEARRRIEAAFSLERFNTVYEQAYRQLMEPAQEKGVPLAV